MNKYKEAINCITSTFLYEEPEHFRKKYKDENLGYCKTLEELVKKATPKKPIAEAMPDFTADMASQLVCPRCKQPIVNVWSQQEYQPRYCHYCGQELDWGKEDGNYD